MASSTAFLWYPGANGTSGLVTTAFNLLTTEIAGLANTSATVSSVNGATGVFQNLAAGQAIFADLYLWLGNPGIASALSTGATLSGWFFTIGSATATTLVEGNVPPPRSPDFIVALPATAISSSAATIFKANGGGPNGAVILPALNYKVVVQNNMGQTVGGATTAPFLIAAPFAVQY